MKIVWDKQGPDAAAGGGGNGDDAGAEGAANNAAAEGGGEGGEEGGEGAADEMQIFEEGEEGGEGGEGAEGGKDKKAKPVKQEAKKDYSRLKEVFEDEDDYGDEEKVVVKVKGLKDENKNLRVLAIGRDAIDKDKDINTYRSLMAQPEETLAFINLVGDYADEGFNDAQAKAKAKAEIDEIKAEEGGEKKIAQMAREARKNLNSNIKARQEEILNDIKTAQKSVDLSPKDSKTVENSKSEVAKLDSFIGFKMPAAHKEKIVKAAQDYIGSEQERKDFANPAVRARIAMFLAHENQWTKNVQARQSGKAQVIKKAITQPKVNNQSKAAVRGPSGARGKDQGKGRIMKNPGAFLGA